MGSSTQNLAWSPLDVLPIRLVVSLVHHVAKRCMPVIPGHKLAPCCVGRDINVGSDDESRLCAWETSLENCVMTARAMSRREMLEAGACILIATAGVPPMANAETGQPSKIGEVVRNYYAAWEKKDWPRLDRLLADEFTFSSPLDAHISKSDYKAGCWDTQIAFIDQFDLKQLIAADNEAFVMYICHTANGKTFQNVEYFQLQAGKVKAVECYFGGKASFPSAVSTEKG